MMAAVVAWEAWDGNGEPVDGWERALTNGTPPFRRRDNGDASTEYVAH